MKTLTAVVAIMMMASAANAGEPTASKANSCFADPSSYACMNISKTAKSYSAALSSANEGVVESALAHVAMIKLSMPACEFKEVRSKVASIERKAGSAELRFKASVTRTVLDNPGMFSNVARTGYAGPDDLFAALANRMGEYYAAK